MSILDYQPDQNDDTESIFLFNEMPPFIASFVSFTLSNGNEEGIAYQYIMRVRHNPKRGEVIINTTKEVITITGQNLALIYARIVQRTMLSIGIGEQDGITIESIELKNKLLAKS